MSVPPSPTAASASDGRISIDRSSILDAVQARAAASRVQEDQFDSEHDVRQMFRRLIDPGIVRAEHHKTRPALELLLQLAENILNNPDEQKYRSFKTTNTRIKRDLIEVKGAVEYAVAMGFRATVRDFQPYYEWLPKYKDHVRIGAAMIREELDRIDKVHVQSERNRIAEKYAAKEAAEKVKLAYIDDRKKKAELDRLERERRLRAVASPAPTVAVVRTTSRSRLEPSIRGEGRTLSGTIEPPPYSADAHPDDVIRVDDDDDDMNGTEDDEPTELRGGRRLGD